MKIKNVIFKITFIVITIFSVIANAGDYYPVKSFKDFESHYKKILKSNGIDSNDILFVFDIDDTLLKSDQYLGSDTWFNSKVSSPFEKYCLFEVAIPKLARHIKYSPVEKSTVSIFKKINHKYDTIALTSRSPDIRLETDRVLSSSGINFKSISFNNKDYSFFDDKKSYYNGIFMTTGFNKGDALLMLLGSDIEKYKYIFFVDDGAKNISAMKNAIDKVKKNNSPELFAYHYTYVADHADKLYSASEVYDADKDWKSFINVYGNSSEKSYCM